MIRRPPIATRTYTPCPYTTLFRSSAWLAAAALAAAASTLVPEEMQVATSSDAPASRAIWARSSLVWSLLPPSAGCVSVAKSLLWNAEYRSEEHTSELQSLMRISYAVFCLKKKKTTQENTESY